MPAIAIAEALRRVRPGVEVLYLGGASGMETEIVPRYGIEFQAVSSRKLHKPLSVGTVGVVFALLKGYREARTFIRAFRANAVAGTGGYAAGATVLAGERCRVPALIHEGNYLVGRTNRLLARGARRICVTFAETTAMFPPGKARMTGLPLRRNIVAPDDVTPAAARAHFEGLAALPFTVFVTGGSQGARALNTVLVEALPALLDAGVQVIHHTGARNYDEIRAQALERRLAGRQGYLAMPFLDEELMPLAYRAADVVVGRGGVSTLSELMVNGVPSIIVPLPTSYADHQTYNARAMEQGGAALHRPQAQLTSAALASDLLHLRDEPARRARMSAASRAMGRPDAADDVAREILEIAA
jgi:UDP-N-acetylglucosamine--N-acetylmuramyl-(pentapeptide) pyrophosphoryl-undecaprenol N-acetylglucosamine transferase